MSQETAETVEKWRETKRRLKTDQGEELRSRERINEIKDATACDAEGWARRNNDLRDEVVILKLVERSGTIVRSNERVGIRSSFDIQRSGSRARSRKYSSCRTQSEPSERVLATHLQQLQIKKSPAKRSPPRRALFSWPPLLKFLRRSSRS